MGEKGRELGGGGGGGGRDEGRGEGEVGWWRDGGRGGGGGTVEGDPTYELASARRNIAGSEPLSRFIENSRKMFLLQVGSFQSHIQSGTSRMYANELGM